MLGVLWYKDQDTRPSKDTIFDSYTGTPPDLVPIDITEYTVMEVGLWLFIYARPGGSDAVYN